MKNLKSLLVAVVVILLATSCKKELEPQILGRWQVMSITGPDHITINAVDSPWIMQIDFSFYAWKDGRRQNGPEAIKHLPGLQPISYFDWTQVSEVSYHLEDKVTKNYNIVIIEFRGQDVAVFTETYPQFRQYVLRFVGK